MKPADELPEEHPPEMRDQELVRKVLGGSTEAWHVFVDSYGNLILASVRRVLKGDDDEVRTVFVQVLDRLYNGLLEQYEGRARLSTWLVLVSRNQALDHLRKLVGRRELPSVLSRFTERERNIFRWYHWDGNDVATVSARLSQNGQTVSQNDVLDALRRIERQLSSRSIRRLTYEVQAASVGAASGRVLEYLDYCRQNEQGAQERLSPEILVVAQEARRRQQRIEAMVQQLPEEDRRALHLRFEEQRSALEISEQMSLGGQRKAYTVIDRALRRLRRLLGEENEK